MFLVLNLGLKSIRSIIFDSKMNILSTSSLPLSTYIDDVQVEQCAEEWWLKSKKVIVESLSKMPANTKITGMTVTASSSCVVPVDEMGLPLGRAIMVSDRRSSLPYQPKNGVKTNGRDDANSVTIEKEGLRTPSMISKITWLMINEPELCKKTKYFLSPNDYFIYRLTGRAVVDTLNAEKSGYCVEQSCYENLTCSAITVDPEKLPEVVMPGTKVGKIVADDFVASMQKCEVVVSTYDAICAFVGSGVQSIGDACDVSGTVTSLRVLGDKSIDNPASNSVFRQVENGLGLCIDGASNNLGGGLIEWCKQAFYSGVGDPYGLMENEARSVIGYDDGLVFLPFLMGERAPLWNDNARGVFFGLSRYHQRQHMTRAVFESAAFSLRLLAEEIEKITEIKTIRVSGGLSRLNLVNQIKADVLNKEILVLDEFETTAIGACAYLMRGFGFSDPTDLINAKSRIRQIIIPDRKKSAKYSGKFEIFNSVYQNLRSSFDKLADFRSLNSAQIKEIVENM